MSKTRVQVINVLDTDITFSPKIANDIIAIKTIDNAAITTSLDDIISDYTVRTGAISSELITSFINYYNHIHNENH